MIPPRSPDELLKAVAAEMQPWIGNNPLEDPAANRSNNLVRLMTIAMRGQSELEYQFEKFINLDNIACLEGELLTLAAARLGIFRKTGTLSKAVLVVTGEDRATLPAGSELTDNFGNIWTVRDDVLLENNGCFCGSGQGIVCSAEGTCRPLRDKELRYDNTLTPAIYSATNGMMLECGGALESDQALRDRILNRGPLANVCGTIDSVVASLQALDGICFARHADVTTCIGDGPMFIVQGGLDADICAILKDQAALSCNLVGETICDPCDGAGRFQRPCPMVIQVRVHLTPDCPQMTADQIKALVMSLAPTVAKGTKLTGYQISKLHPDIDYVDMKIRRPHLHSCPDQTGVSVTEPCSGEPFVYDHDNPWGLCPAVPECYVDKDLTSLIECDEWRKAIQLNPWQYPILDLQFIEVVSNTECPVEPICATCD